MTRVNDPLLVYIAGPCRADNSMQRQRNIRLAEELGLLVAECGAMPVIPHTMTEHFHGMLEESFWLAGTVRLMHVCDGLALTHTWERSSGARAEREWAEAHHMPWVVDDVSRSASGRRWWISQFVEELRRQRREAVEAIHRAQVEADTPTGEPHA